MRTFQIWWTLWKLTFSSSWPRDQTGVSCTSGGFVTIWATREALSTVGKSESERCSVMSNSLPPHGPYSPWSSLGQNTGVGSLSFLQRIFPTQGLNPGLPHCRRILYQLSHKGSPRILEWVAYLFSIGRQNQFFTQVKNKSTCKYIALKI